MPHFELQYGAETQRLKLEDGEHSVGRSAENSIRIPMARVSKQHAIVRIEGERVFVRDVGSTNGTEVDGDRIGEEEVSVPTDGFIRFASATLRRAMTSSASLQVNTMISRVDVSPAARHNVRDNLSNAARDRFVDLSSELFELLASQKGAEELGTTACRFIAKFIRAQRVVLLEDEGEGTPVDIRSRWPEAPDGTPLQLSQSIIAEVLQSRDAILVANPLEDPRFLHQQSIMSLNLRSAMAAPLFDNERVRGILYVDTAETGTQYSADDLQVLTATANAVAVKLRNMTLEQELQTAARIQRNMLPANLVVPKGYELEAFQEMCREVGGDLYQCIQRPDGKTLIALGDVSGKGMPAALAMSAAVVLIGLLAKVGKDLLEIATYLHSELFASLGEEQFITMFIAELDPASGVIRYVNAAHEPPLLYRDDGTQDSLESHALGFAMMDYNDIEVQTAEMGAGDLLFIFSDGIPEATKNGDSFLGLDKVKEHLENMRTKPLSDIRSVITGEIDTFLSGAHNSDDVTLMLLRRVGG